MKRAFIKEYPNRFEVKIIDIENNMYHQHMQSKNSRFPFGSPIDYTMKDMGYDNAKDCIKKLKARKQLGDEIDLTELKEVERTGYIKLGVQRLKRAGMCDCSKIVDICNNLIKYGMNYIDAQEQIIGMYELDINQSI